MVTGHRADGPVLVLRPVGDVTLGQIPLWTFLALVVVLAVGLLIVAHEGDDL